MTKEAKKAKDSDSAFKIQEEYEGVPHGWVQWKGTNVWSGIHYGIFHVSYKVIVPDFEYLIYVGY